MRKLFWVTPNRRTGKLTPTPLLYNPPPLLSYCSHDAVRAVQNWARVSKPWKILFYSCEKKGEKTPSPSLFPISSFREKMSFERVCIYTFAVIMYV